MAHVATIDEIIQNTRVVAKLDGVQDKTASYVAPASPIGNQLRELARQFKETNLLDVKLAGLREVLDGNIPSVAALAFTTKTAADLNITISPRDSDADGFRKLASATREVADQLKIASLVDGMNTVRGFGAIKTLQMFLL